VKEPISVQLNVVFASVGGIQMAKLRLKIPRPVPNARNAAIFGAYRGATSTMHIRIAQRRGWQGIYISRVYIFQLGQEVFSSLSSCECCHNNHARYVVLCFHALLKSLSD
jgi:hypothetical protein